MNTTRLVLRVIRKHVAQCAVVAAIAFNALPVSANVGPVYIAGEQISPNTKTNVVLERETIDILLSPMSAQVVCDFYLRNTGDTETLTLAFPGKDETEGDFRNQTMKDFSVAVNGSRITTTYQSDFKRNPNAVIHTVSEQYGWYVWESTFPSNRNIHIQITYTALNHNLGFTNNPYGGFRYILATGRLWKDTIGSLDITVRLSDMEVCQITDFRPKNGEVHPDQSMKWHFENFEPDENSKRH